jgi:hypothetical protein
MTTGMIDEDPAHDLRGDTKEVRPIQPVDLPLVDEPQIRLVYECSRLQGVPDTLPSKLARGNPTELRVDQGQQLLLGSPDSNPRGALSHREEKPSASLQRSRGPGVNVLAEFTG